MKIPASLIGTDIVVDIIQFTTVNGECKAVAVTPEGYLRTYNLQELQVSDPMHRPGFQASRPYIPPTTI